MINVLIVCSGNSPDASIPFDFSIHQAFIDEQIKSMVATGKVNMDVFLIEGKGILGYVRHYPKLLKVLSSKKYDVVHSHFSLSGLLAVMQRRVPVVVTFHGSDVNLPRLKIISMIVHYLSKKSIVVEKGMIQKFFVKRVDKFYVIPCGIDLDIFYPASMDEARVILGLDRTKTYVLFSSSFDRYIKNAPLAIQAVGLIDGADLLEIKGKSRSQVAQLINASNALLMTSYSEGSPQIVKEALACNVPVVSTDVGDVSEMIKDIEGCYICDYDAVEISEKLKMAMQFRTRVETRDRVLKLDNRLIAHQLSKVYANIVS